MMHFKFVCEEDIEILLVMPHDTTIPITREKVIQMLYGPDAKLVKRRQTDAHAPTPREPKKRRLNGTAHPLLPPKS